MSGTPNLDAWFHFAERLFKFWGTIENIDWIKVDDDPSPVAGFAEKLMYVVHYENGGCIERGFMLKAIRVLSQGVIQFLPKILMRDNRDPRYHEAAELFLREHADALALLALETEVLRG